ncbi:MAG TPA: alpha-amylase family glycosyl hydrolase [Saprospiraceae bacterium]|nr:alpha-amylase family glycosyl hydrolase [Saprospiraceae bacterium]HMP25150.1 alpha-amylase family glycosyl hydrolase [Saprospiraceae bacterium]
MQNLFRFIFFYLLCTTAIAASAQVLYTEPFFPKIDQPVTIFFDATQGSGGLRDCNCDVYLHTGVITNASTSPSDWKNVVTTWGQSNSAWRMTRVPGEANLYSYTIGPSIRSYYNVGATTQVQRMAFVFRNANGSREGKDVGNSDIYYDVFPNNLPFTALLLNPTAGTLVRDIGESINISLVTSEAATITVFRNGNEVTQTSGTRLDYALEVTTTGTNTVEILADNGATTQTTSFTYATPLALAEANPPAGTQLGATLLNGDTKVRLALFAPGKKHVFVLGDFNDWTPDTDYQMTPSADGTFWIEIEGLIPGENYTYQYLVDGTLRVADPYSTLVLDPFNDPFIPAVIYPNLPAYPRDKTAGNVTLLQPGAPEYQWQVTDFERPAKEKLVIYELLLRDFVARHDYNTLVDTLDYLERLGVNAIELLPVNEFEGNISWGYNPSFHMALDKYYGTINDFKRFVDECHRRGIAVILDVVYNHAFGQSPLAQLYWDNANNRPAANNPWLNPVARHPFNVGFDFNHESPATRTYVERNIRYWLSEFRLDGFRFDLSKGFTQRQSNDVGAWNQYDANRIAILKHYTDVMWETTPGSYAIMEHFAENREETELSDYGMMLWAGFGPHDNYLEAAMGYGSNFASASYQNRNWRDPHLIVYIESHDEERMVYKNQQFGNASANYNIRSMPTALRRAELANAFFYTIPGPKMLWQFGEVGYDFPINYCPNGTVNQACRTDPKPIRWDYYNDPDRRRLYDVTAALTHLKTNYETFNTTDFQLNTSGFLKSIRLNHPEMDAVVLGNFAVTNGSVAAPFSRTGTWYEYFSGDSLEVSTTPVLLPFSPGEYRLYTSVRLTPPAGVITSAPAVVRDYFGLSVAPNPSNGDDVQVQYKLEKGGQVRLEIFNMMGQKLQTVVQTRQPSGLYSERINLLDPGLYLLRLTVDDKIETQQLVVTK